MQHFARAQARQLRAHGPHLFEHLLGALGRALAALVKALPAHAVELATARQAQLFFADQPGNGRRKDFFGRGMPWSTTTSGIVRNTKFRFWASFNSLAAKYFYSRNCVSSCLIRCSGVCSTAGAVPGKVGLAARKVTK